MDELIKMLEQAMDVTVVDDQGRCAELSGHQRLMILKALRAAAETVGEPYDASKSGAG